MKISAGKLYLFEERVPLRAHQTLRKELSKGREALYISKNSPHQLRAQFTADGSMLLTLWLSPRPDEGCIPPMNLKAFERRVAEFLGAYPEGIVAINGLDVLEMWNGVRPVLDVMRRTRSKVSVNGNSLIISMDPNNLSQRTVAELEKLSDMVIASSPEN